MPHTLQFNATEVKKQLGLMNIAWSGFIKQVQKMVKQQLNEQASAQFFEDILRQGDSKPLSPRAEREKQTLTALFKSAPGQDLPTAHETAWGAVNAMTYYADHVRSGTDRLDSAWFGAGAVLKEKAWTKALDLIALHRN